jgi:hypothetical protein
MPTLDVDGRTISFVRDGKLSGRPLFLFAHGAGAPYTSPFMAETARGLARRGLCVVRFHFPYMEEAQRLGKKKPPGPAKRLLATWRAMLERAAKMRNHGPIVIGGKSMGGRMASMLLARGEAPQVRGAVYLGYPLHPAGRPEKLRADHLGDVPVPQLFVQGEKDRLCEPERLAPILERLDDVRHVQVPGADHSLARSRKAPMEGSEGWLDAVAEFVKEVAR